MNNLNERKYNGWTNYATWRVNLEILSDIEFEEYVTATELSEIVEECVFRNPNTCDTPYLVEDYANAFISQVNFDEIAEHINEEIN
jgi:hypothetical protein